MLDRNTHRPDPDAIAAFLEHCHRRSYQKRAAIIRPGDAANTLYYIVEGSVSVIAEDAEGRELILAYSNPGDFIGEMGLFMDVDQRGVLVRARTQCETAEVSYERLEQLFVNELQDFYPQMLKALGLQLTRRLLHTSRTVRSLAFYDVAGRVARTLEDLTGEPDAMTHPDGMQIKISRQEISRIVGCSREMAGRVLKTLEEDGMIDVAGKTIVVLERDEDE